MSKMTRHLDNLKRYYHNEDVLETCLQTYWNTDKEILWPEIEDTIELGGSCWEKPSNHSIPPRCSNRNRKAFKNTSIWFSN